LARFLLFPSVNDANKPVSDSTASDWLTRAEQLAGLEHLERGRWHPFRRAWATARKHLPVKDVAQAGGWQSTAVLLNCYLLPDDLTIEEVILSPKRIKKSAPRAIPYRPQEDILSAPGTRTGRCGAIGLLVR
jgi:Phage integrase family